MVDLDWKAKMVSSDLPTKSPKLSNKLHLSIPTPLFRGVTNLSPIAAPDSACSAYDHYLRLPDLRKLWESNDFPDWKNESLLKPALHALEITFRFISTVLSDPRHYANQREWTRRLQSLTTSQIELIAILCEDDCGTSGSAAPIVDLSSSSGVLARDGSHAEVWKLSGETTVVNRRNYFGIPGSHNNFSVNSVSEGSLLPRLAAWQKSEDVAQRILYSIEAEMRRCPYTLGLGELNISGKPNLDYDAVCRPAEIHALKRSPYDHQIENHENQTVYTTHQILESWIQVGKEVIKRVTERIESKRFDEAANDCYLLERTWKLLEEIQDLHLLMDPNDFLRLKHQLLMNSPDETEAFCFRSRGLVEMTRSCRNLKHRVPEILGVVVDPKGGPRIQQEAMRLYKEKGDVGKIHLLQGLQAVEGRLKRFYFAYKQVLVVAVGSLEANKGRGVTVGGGWETGDWLSRLFMEPTYFPSLDAAKTFLGESWNH